MSDLEKYRDLDTSLPSSAASHAAIDPVRTQAQLDNVESFIQTAMRKGVHYGTIPGVPKPFLWKGGAELLAGLFNYGVRAKRDDLLSVVDRAAELVEITVKVTVFSRTTGRDLWDSDGFASSMEACFRRRACPVCRHTVRRDKEKRGTFHCDSCDWTDEERELADALAVDFGSTTRNVAARAQKRAMVRAIQEACGVTAFFLAPQTWEQEEDGKPRSNGSAAGNCPKCGIGTLIERARKSDGEPFWACNNNTWDARTQKRSGCDWIQNEPPQETAAEPTSEPPAETSSEPNAAAVAVLEIVDSQGRDTDSKKMFTLGKACAELKMAPPQGSDPLKWLSSLSDEDLGRLTTALTAKPAEVAG